MRVDALHYELPPELIAQRPAAGSRARAPAAPAARRRRRRAPPRRASCPSCSPRGALVVVNDTRVIPARLLGRKRETGGRVEVFLRPARRARARSRPGRRARAPPRSGGRSARRASPSGSGPTSRSYRDRAPRAPRPAMADCAFACSGARAEDGLLEVALWTTGGGPVDAAVRACGHVPLPPYIKRDDAPRGRRALPDRLRAPRRRGRRADGRAPPDRRAPRAPRRRAAATSRASRCTSASAPSSPSRSRTSTSTRCTPSATSCRAATADAVARARARAAPRSSPSGTTTVARARERRRPGRARATCAPASGETRLLIQPGYAWRVVDGLLTNFHLPRSTLLALVCAFAGHRRTSRRVPARRGRERYRFFSYGDAMLLWRARLIAADPRLRLPRPRARRPRAPRGARRRRTARSRPPPSCPSARRAASRRSRRARSPRPARASSSATPTT